MRVTIDKMLCCGTGLCEHICPQIFRVVRGVCTTKKTNVPRAAIPLCREAAESCPNRAIRLV